MLFLRENSTSCRRPQKNYDIYDRELQYGHFLVHEKPYCDKHRSQQFESFYDLRVYKIVFSNDKMQNKKIHDRNQYKNKEKKEEKKEKNKR